MKAEHQVKLAFIYFLCYKKTTPHLFSKLLSWWSEPLLVGVCPQGERFEVPEPDL